MVSTSKFLHLLLYELVVRSWGLIRIMFHVWQDCLTGDDVYTLPPTHSVLSVLAVNIDKGVSLVHPPKNSHQHKLSSVLTNFNNHSPNTLFIKECKMMIFWFCYRMDWWLLSSFKLNQKTEFGTFFFKEGFCSHVLFNLLTCF